MRLTSHKGFGLFALQDIPRGTRIIVEPSMVTIPASKSATEHIWNEFRSLTPEQHDQVCDLFVPDTIDPAQSSFLRHKLSLHHQYTSKFLVAALHDEAKMRAIFIANAIPMGSNGKDGKGIFLYARRLNHSDVPNVHQHYNATLNMSTVHATRDIKEGEELLRSYIPYFHNDLEQRDGLLLFWDIDCDCAACCGPHATMHKQLRRRTSEHVVGMTVYDMGFGNASAPSGPRQALTWAEEVVGLLKQQGLEDMELARA